MTRRIVVGSTLQDAAARVADAWHRAERGEAVSAADTLSFPSWADLAAVMTENRFQLLRLLHRHPGETIVGLAGLSSRPLAEVNRDMVALKALGLVAEDGDGFRADYDRIETSIELAA